MKIIFAKSKIILIIALMFILTNCVDDHLARYEDPPWLGGSIIETLEADSTYTILLDLMRKAGYEEPITKGLFTVFAANDSAYQAYFDSKGIASVDELSEKEALKLFTLNVMNTPRSRNQLIYDYLPWHGGWQEANSEIGALLWRVETRSKSEDQYDDVRYFKTYQGETLKILGQEKKVPLLSTEFFTEYGGNPDGSDYNYFFPDTKWSGLQWYNANIVKAEVKASNGFIYYLDRAVPEIPSIEEYLRANQDKFGVYYDLIQRFASYSFSSYDDDVDKTRLYNKSYLKISNIVSEVGPSANPPYDRRNSFSAFVPTNNVLQKYIDEKFLTSFPSLDSVPEITLVFLAQSCITSHFEIASKMERSLINSYGDEIAIDIYNDVDDAILLSNGPLMTMNKYYPPRAFSSTVGPVFFNNKHTTFLYGINQAKMISTFTSADLDVTIFAPTNDGLLNGGIRYYEPSEQLEMQVEDGTWVAMDEFEIKSFVSDHVCSNNQVDYSGEGYVLMNSKNYIYYNNNVIQGGGNQELGNSTKIISTEKGDNGILYAIDNAILGPKYDHASFIGNDEDLSEFYNLLYLAGISDTTIDAETELESPNINFLQLYDFWTVFAPTNDAIITARNNGQIPEDIDELKDFLRYHFIPEKVIFDDGGDLKGIFPSYKIDSMTFETTYVAPIEIENIKNNMSIIDRLGNKVDVNHNSADRLVQRGVLHKIDKILQN